MSPQNQHLTQAMLRKPATTTPKQFQTTRRFGKDGQHAGGAGDLESAFFLWCGRSRSKARSLHENKLLSRKTSTWTQVVACELANHDHQTQNTTTKGQDADPPARFASHLHKDSKANSERGKSPTETTTKDLPRTQWWKPTVSQTQKHAAKLVATQWSETRDQRCCRENNNGSHLLYTLA